jgi:Leucine-rich repeat (LRR) protein
MSLYRTLFSITALCKASRLVLIGITAYLGTVSVATATTDCQAVTEISSIECESLLQLYRSTDGANWKYNDGWNVTNTPCSWFGVTCEENVVTAIDLGLSSPCNNLKGTLPNFLGLPSLQRLELDNNLLTGKIPDFTGLPNLQLLELSWNQLNGPLPNFSGIPKLQTLEIRWNRLTGKVPNFRYFPWLMKLNLGGNQLTGTIPDFRGMPRLRELAIYDNKLTGVIPDFTGLPNLEHMNISENQLTGVVPNFSALPKLAIIYLSDNQLMGAIPDFNSLTNLLGFDLSNNHQLCRNPNIDDSQWQDQLSDFDTCPPLSAAFTVLAKQGQSPFTVHLDATPSASYDGEIVQYDWGIDEQETLSGLQTSTTLAKAGEYQIVLTVTDNEGKTAFSLPTVITVTTNCGSVIDVSSWECESLLQLYQSTNGAQWNHNEGWNVSDAPCRWYGVICENGHVIAIELNQNNLKGKLPEFRGLPWLQKLFLPNNELVGEVLDFRALPNLRELDLSHNQLTGTIPNFRYRHQLQTLVLSDNQLTGEIPDFRALPKLLKLEIEKNQLTGSIPNFSRTPYLQVIALGENQLTGQIPNFNRLPKLQMLALSGNQLTGEIPNFRAFRWLHTFLLKGNDLCKNPQTNYSKWQQQLSDFPECSVDE